MLREIQSPELTVFDRFPQLKEVPKEKYPKHLLIIPDGDVRWATILGAIPVIGHQHGAKVLKETLRALRDLPIEIVTIWGLSADNWKRPQNELNGIMQVAKDTIDEGLPEFQQYNVRVIHLGRKDRINPDLRASLEKVEEITKNNSGQKLCLAIDYGGEDQELLAMQTLVDLQLPLGTRVTPELRENLFSKTVFIPPADLVMRTSGELRYSDLGRIMRNSEFYTIKPLLPDAKVEDFINGIVDFSKRTRRMGKSSKE